MSVSAIASPRTSTEASIRILVIVDFINCMHYLSRPLAKESTGNPVVVLMRILKKDERSVIFNEAIAMPIEG
jgi:hypothetical protein